MAPRTIVVPLERACWRPSANGGKGEWRCWALSLPSATFAGLLRVDDSEVTTAAYAVRGTRIIWKGGGAPKPGMKVRVRLRRRLFSGIAVVFALGLGVLGGVLLQTNMKAATARMSAVLRMIPASLTEST